MPPISSAIRRAATSDGAILLDVERGQMFSLNTVGSRILELLGKGWNEPQIVAELSATFGADVERVRCDVREFLELLARHHVLDETAGRPQGGPRK